MSSQGILVVFILSVLFILWMSNLVRRGRLHAAYAVVWIVWIVVGTAIVCIPPVLTMVTSLFGATNPISVLSLLAFVLLFAMQIYLLSQLSIISRRVMLIAQHIGIHEAQISSSNPTAKQNIQPAPES